jgi:hypothetical protein
VKRGNPYNSVTSDFDNIFSLLPSGISLSISHKTLGGRYSYYQLSKYKSIYLILITGIYIIKINLGIIFKKMRKKRKFLKGLKSMLSPSMKEILGFCIKSSY